MDRHTFIGKNKIGFTRIYDFTDYQGLGSDPLYKRYPSVLSIIRQVIPAQYVDFLAIPDQPAGEDIINWYVPQWNDTPQRLTDLAGQEAMRYRKIKDETLAVYNNALNTLSGEELMVMGSVLRYIDDEFIYCADGRVFVLAWGMTPDASKHVPIGEIVHVAPNLIRYTVTFDAGPNGSLRSNFDKQRRLTGGTVIDASMIPEVIPADGFEFEGWMPQPVEGRTVEADITFTAHYKEKEELPPPPPLEPVVPLLVPAEIKFEAGPHGLVKGESVLSRQSGDVLTENDIPRIAPSKGFRFAGWDQNPVGYVVDGNHTFTARYEKVKSSIWSKWWFWLLMLLLLLLVAWLLSEFLPGCTSLSSSLGCSRDKSADDVIISYDEDDPEASLPFKPIIPVDGKLPGDENAVVAPVRDPGGQIPEPIRNPGVPPTLPGRLFLFLEDENGNVDQLASDFKAAYPGDNYSIIGFDREVKSLVVQVPEAERDAVRESIQQRLPQQRFLVMDEKIYELNSSIGFSNNDVSQGWHLDAVNASQAWTITKGSADVVVAVVDDGFDGTHPMFQGRIVAPYNVFTQNNHLSLGSGHGTHTAGLAVGSQINLSKGVSGMAPNCKLMPVQVFDNGMCPMSALISGILYAVHKGADVVNVSIGPEFPGLNILPVEAQDEIAQTRFKNEELLWARVTDLANRKGAIIVFAAGNETIVSGVAPENRTKFAIAVGAIDRKFQATSFSNFGWGTDVSAPGSDILSSWAGGGLKAVDGTSMSAPIVAGTIALMKSLKKDLTVEQARNVLQRTGIPVSIEMPPRILADRALTAVRNGDFSAPPAQSSAPVGSTTIDNPAAPSSPALPVQKNPGSDRVPIGWSAPAPPTGGTPAVPVDDVDDDEAILRQIRFYKDRIKELEKQLKHKV